MAALASTTLPPTDRIYLSYEGCFQLTHENAKLLSYSITPSVDTEETSNPNEPVKVDLIFDRSPFHPQGGGQPSDIGIIVDNISMASFKVTKCSFSFATNLVTHHCVCEDGQPSFNLEGENSWKLSVDEETRLLYSKYHSAGHLVDSAMYRLGYELPPEKGYHFLDGPYVEYKGAIPAEKRDELVSKLKEEFVTLCKEDIPTTICMMTKEEAEKELNRTQKNFDFEVFSDPEVRIVGVAGFRCPCGGTHVRSTKELEDFTVTGLKVKKGKTKVKYDRIKN
mmetsp:Transcript_4985/g.9523  ORF Transcript_4985/g.9523 Transcript_4985/m.9523 type:complete len:280 (+) Transcript_4985:25-864(+)